MTLKEWPSGRLNELKQLAKDGYSAREIVERLWLSGFKTTRNAVLGKAHRNNIDVGIVSKAGYLQSTRFGRKGKEPKSDMPPNGPLPDRGLCQWPIGDVWCGCCVKGTSAYCVEHHAVAYTGIKVLTWGEAKTLFDIV
jgi:hypothetical protein